MDCVVAPETLGLGDGTCLDDDGRGDGNVVNLGPEFVQFGISDF